MPAPLRAALVPAPTVAASEAQQKQDCAAALLAEGNDCAALTLMEEVLAAKIVRGDSMWAYAESLVIAYNRAAVRRAGCGSKEQELAVRQLRRAEALLQESPAFVGFHPLRQALLSATYNNLALLAQGRSDTDAALAHLAKAAECDTRQHPSPLTLLNQAALSAERRQGDAAVRLVDAATAVAAHYVRASEGQQSPAAGPTARTHFAAHVQEQRRLLVLAELTQAELQLFARSGHAQGMFSTALASARLHLGESHELTARARAAFEQVPLLDSTTAPRRLTLAPADFSSSATPSQLLPFVLRNPPPKDTCDSPKSAGPQSPAACAVEPQPSRPVQLPDINRPDGTPRRQSTAHGAALLDADAPERFLRLRDFQQRSAALGRKFLEQQTPRLTRLVQPQHPRARRFQQSSALCTPAAPTPAKKPAPPQSRSLRPAAPASAQSVGAPHVALQPVAPSAPGPRMSLATPVRRPVGSQQSHRLSRSRRSVSEAESESRRLQQEWEQKFTSQAQTLYGNASEVGTPSAPVPASAQGRSSVFAKGREAKPEVGWTEWGTAPDAQQQQDRRRSARRGSRPLSRPSVMTLTVQDGDTGDGSVDGDEPELLTAEDWHEYESIKALCVTVAANPATERALRSDIEEVRRLSIAHGLPVADVVVPILPHRAEPWTNAAARARLHRTIRVQMQVQEFAKCITTELRRRQETARKRRQESARRIQHAYRGMLQRREAVAVLHSLRAERALRQQHQAATDIQRIVRGRRGRAAAAARRWEMERQLMRQQQWERRCEVAAVVIQSVWRGCMSRDMVLLRDDAAARIQLTYRVWRVYVELTSVVACRRLWRTRFRAANSAARRIQLCWCGLGGRRAARHELERRRWAVVAARDAEVATARADWEAAKLRRMDAATVVVARHLFTRRSVGVVAAAAARAARRLAAVGCIQRLRRRVVARRRVQQQRVLHAGGEATRRRCEEVHEAATSIAALARGRAARREAARRRAARRAVEAAVRVMQRVWRGHAGRLRTRTAEARRQRRRCRYLERSTREDAAVTIQCTFRRFRALCQAELITQVQCVHHSMARRMQRLARRFLARKLAQDRRWERCLQREDRAAADWRACAAARIQAVWRSHRCRRRLERRRLLRVDGRERAAAVIQRAYQSRRARRQRRCRAGSRARRLAATRSGEAMQWCATLLQAVWRAAAVRAALPSLRRRAPLRLSFAWQSYSLRLDRLIALRAAGQPAPKPIRPPPSPPPPRRRRVQTKPRRHRRYGALAALARVGRPDGAAVQFVRYVAAERIARRWRWSRRRDVRKGLLHTVYIKSLWRRNFRRLVDAMRMAATEIQRTWRGAAVRLGPKLQRMRAQRRRELVRLWIAVETGQLQDAGPAESLHSHSVGRYGDAVRYARWAALHVQTWWRVQFAKLRLRRVRRDMRYGLREYDRKEEREFAASLVQKVARGFFAKRRVRRMHAAARRIAGFLRFAVAVQVTGRRRQQKQQSIRSTLVHEREAAATAIQRQWRARRR